MFHHSYQPRRFAGDLALITFGKLGGDSGDTKLFQSLSNSSLSRDERAPVNPTAEDLAGFERRDDIQKLRREMREAVDPDAANCISKKIRNIITSLSRLKVQERRDAYFPAADQRRGQGLATDDLAETSTTARQTPATRVGQFLRFGETGQHGHSWLVGKLLLDFLQNRLSPLYEEASIASSESKVLPTMTSSEIVKIEQSGSGSDAVSTCLLCLEPCANRSSLTRHHKRRHLLTTFQQPFSCPECLRLQVGDHLIDSAPAWSNHAETYHGKNNAPNLPIVHKVWYAAPESEQAWCLICSKPFRLGKGFGRHLRKHKDDGIFAQPFQCIECPEGSWIDGVTEWIDHSARVHGGCPRTGAGPKRPCDDQLADEPNAKKVKVAAGQEYEAPSDSQLGDYVPIDPALFLLNS